MAPRTVLDPSSKFRRSIGRVFLFLGMGVPGFLLTFFARTWTNSIALGEVQHIPHALLVLGILLLLGSLLVLFERYRDFGYILGAVFYSVILLGDIFSFYHNDHHASAIASSVPVLIWIYAEAAITASRTRENIENQTSSKGG